ncbi:hypothetical protein K2173_017604 [Erythroxylum novogranatense]|uniref:Peptidase A1 domain-containing protein n=1 Tax=Erythroxylum novogranatense TaxID=1862640 RepID=A0AAV8TNK1_9ROSI|nr:hypothetical protein K2173_017604 [Erythroxylum novogranatense]
MASSHLVPRLCSFLCIITLLYAQPSHLPNHAVVLPVTKDPSSLQYLTKLSNGRSLVPVMLVLDLAGPFLWVDSVSNLVSFSTRRVPSCSLQCSSFSAKALGLKIKTCFSATHSNICDVPAQNSITKLATRSELVEDLIAINPSNKGSKSGKITNLDKFLFSSAPSFLLNGLASGARGMLGLGMTTTSLPSQLALTFGFQRKFTTCLSQSNGLVLFGNESVDPIFGTELTKSLLYTPLADPAGGGGSQEYFITVKSINVNGKQLDLNNQEGAIGWARISSVVPYTTLENSIYNTFVKAYSEAANSMNITRVAPVAPFGLCFSSKEVASGAVGPVVPTIDLTLQSKMVKWRINGRNSMVRLSDGVMCLGLVDGGLNSNIPIVIGGFQLEDNLLEFDLGTRMLGFSNSLLRFQRSCSDML